MALFGSGQIIDIEVIVIRKKKISFAKSLRVEINTSVSDLNSRSKKTTQTGC